MKILIADDSKINSLLLDEILSKYGQTIIVTDGFQVITEFQSAIEKNDLFDILCLDIEMPYLDGIEVLNTIRRIEDELKIKKSVIFMITSTDNIMNILESFENQANEYILKDSNLLNRIEECIKKYFSI